MVKGNLLEAPVDAIVNAANGHLMQAESDRLLTVSGPFATGTAVVTSAGRPPFKGVIHAVGPRQGEGDEGRKLLKALTAAFAIAKVRRAARSPRPRLSEGGSCSAAR